jgi:hypothetical protein
MNACQRIDNLEFDDNRIFYYYVKTIRQIEPNAFTDNRQRDLPSGRNAPPIQFMDKAMFICRFQQSGSQRPMNLQPGIDNCSGEPLHIRANPFVRLVCFVLFLIQNDASATTTSAHDDGRISVTETNHALQDGATGRSLSGAARSLHLSAYAALPATFRP